MISANLSKSVRRAIYKRDGYRCALCDSPVACKSTTSCPVLKAAATTP